MHISFLKLGTPPHQLFLAPFVTGDSVVGFIQKTAKRCDEFTPQSLVWHLSACPCLFRFTCSYLELLAKTRWDDCISTSSVSLTLSKMWHLDKSPLVLLKIVFWNGSAMTTIVVSPVRSHTETHRLLHLWSGMLDYLVYARSDGRSELRD